LDVQAGLEYGMSIYNATLNGCNIIHDCGYLESGLTSSFESVLFADEIIGMIKYMLRPLDFNDETVPFELMERVGPGGSFLVEEHTAENFRKKFWFPRFLNRKVYEIWEGEGSKDLRTALNERAKSIFEGHTPKELSEKAVKAIREIVANHRPDTKPS
jgi:trimethylamine--corrinoid protein Co-methyltransferase